MCTVTLLPLPGGLRLLHSRDEQRSRPAALPPRLVHVAGRKAVYPIDPVSSGTWVGVNDAGLVLALLNVNPMPRLPAPVGSRSRGLIIPELLSAGDLDDALARLKTWPLDDHPPFRLVLAHDGQQANLSSCPGQTALTQGPIDRPLLFTSSGLGDALVEGPRRRLFESAVGNVASQEAFHRHSWRDRPEWSVCMRRTDACTVSLTTIEIVEDAISLRHHPGPPDQPAHPVEVSLSSRERAIP